MTDHVKGDKQLISRIRSVSHRAAPRQILMRWQMRTTQLAKVNAPKKTGNLKRAIRPGLLVGTHATVVAATNYAVYVEKGTRPHDIYPRNARVLAWSNIPGATRLSGNLRSGQRPNVFARRVHHPGTRAQPFLEPAAKQALGEIGIGFVIDAWNAGA